MNTTDYSPSVLRLRANESKFRLRVLERRQDWVLRVSDHLRTVLREGTSPKVLYPKSVGCRLQVPCCTSKRQEVQELLMDLK